MTYSHAEQLEIERAVTTLKNGGVIAYPTDTVYGLGCDAFNEQSVARIFQIKQRPSNQTLPLLIADASALFLLAGDLTEDASRLVEQFWPGGLTLVVRKATSLPDWLTAGENTIALRVPNHPVTLELIRLLGGPLIGTSANLSRSPSVTTAYEVREQLGESVDFILDGGECPGGIESTVLDVTGEVAVILRQGAVSHDDIVRVCTVNNM